ncbi:MAG TPA: hypothetical protein VEK57_00930 [Thermoanaerobaculia bacterium]|nr:hypothetical protein [Thermoanaerobaculia bacterium]
MSTHFHIVILNEATAGQINGIHELLKRQAPVWWHHFDNSWIVQGDRSAAQWREVIASGLGAGRASALIVRLPDDAVQRQDWSYFGIETDKRVEWLDQNLTAPRKSVD